METTTTLRDYHKCWGSEWKWHANAILACLNSTHRNCTPYPCPFGFGFGMRKLNIWLMGSRNAFCDWEIMRFHSMAISLINFDHTYAPSGMARIVETNKMHTASYIRIQWMQWEMSVSATYKELNVSFIIPVWLSTIDHFIHASILSSICMFHLLLVCR